MQLSPEQLLAIEDLVKAGVSSFEQIAQFLELNDEDEINEFLYHVNNPDSELYKVYYKAKLEKDFEIGQKLYTKAKEGDTKAIKEIDRKKKDKEKKEFKKKLEPHSLRNRLEEDGIPYDFLEDFVNSNKCHSKKVNENLREYYEQLLFCYRQSSAYCPANVIYQELRNLFPSVKNDRVAQQRLNDAIVYFNMDSKIDKIAELNQIIRTDLPKAMAMAVHNDDIKSFQSLIKLKAELINQIQDNAPTTYESRPILISNKLNHKELGIEEVSKKEIKAFLDTLDLTTTEKIQLLKDAPNLNDIEDIECEP